MGGNGGKGPRLRISKPFKILWVTSLQHKTEFDRILLFIENDEPSRCFSVTLYVIQYYTPFPPLSQKKPIAMSYDTLPIGALVLFTFDIFPFYDRSLSLSAQIQLKQKGEKDYQCFSTLVVVVRIHYPLPPRLKVWRRGEEFLRGKGRGGLG